MKSAKTVRNNTSVIQPSGFKGKPAAPAPAALQPGVPLWQYALAAFLVFFIALEVYSPALQGPFVFDDVYLPFLAPSAARWNFLQWVGVRPLLMTSFWLNYQSAGTEPYAYHVTNVLLHVLNAGLIYFVVRKLLEWAKTPSPSRQILAAFAAGLFLLHPVQTESVAYVASRSETLSLPLFLGSYLVFLYRRQREVSFVVAIAILTLFGAAALTKEHAVVLPALLLLTDYYWNPGFSFDGIKRNWRLYGLMALGGVAGLALVLRVLSASNSAGFGIKDLTWYQYLFTQCRVIWIYVGLYLFPYGLNIDPDVPISRTLLDHGAIFGLAALVAVVAAAVIYRKRYPLASFGVMVTLLLLAPTSSIVPLRDAEAEHRLYLPFLGLLLITVEILRRSKLSRPALAGILALVLTAAGWATYNRNQAWSSSIALWRDSVSKSPAKPRPRFQLAYAYYQAGQPNDAVREYDAASKLEPPDYRLLVDWALAYDQAGRPAEALDKLSRAAALEQNAHAYALIGMVHAKQGHRAEALAALSTAEKLDSNFEMTYVYRGNVYSEAGEFTLAAEAYQRALALDPGNQVARNGLNFAQQRLQVKQSP